MIKKVLGTFLIMLFSIVLFLFIKTGAYMSAHIVKVESPKFQLFYIENIGPYHKIITTLKEVEDFFKKQNLPCKLSFGHFLSDPDLVEHDKLISHVGCAFTPENSPQLFNLPENMKVKFFGNPKQNCYKGTFEGSPSLTAMKVYPKINQQALEDRVKLDTDILEIYEVINENNVATTVYRCFQ